MIRQDDFCGFRRFTIERGTLALAVTEYGATALSLRHSGRELLLGFALIEEYEHSGAYIGAIVGRWANRIGGAAFELDGRRWALSANEGKNSLHGGNEGKPWNKRRWSGRIEDDESVSFTLLSPHGDNGFPGNLTARVVYRLLPDGLRIEFEGSSDRDTYFAPTSHMYFSLGEENILGAELQISASGHLEVDEGLIPTGKILPAEGDFDFSAPRVIGRDYDDCFVLSGSPACTVRTTALKMTLFTDFPALQFYTGKYLDGGFAPNAGLALEPEYFPDTPNKPQFPDARLRAGEKFCRYLEFRFE